jgi:hypothetical protein
VAIVGARHVRAARRAPILLALPAGWLLMALLAALGPSVPRTLAQCTTASFGAAAGFPVGRGPASVAAADLNADGRLDLVTANFRSNDVSVLLGSGGGTFTAASNFPVDWPLWSIAVEDLNGDGRPDLATANLDRDSVSVLLNTC